MNPSDLDANILKLLDGDLTAEEIAALEVELLDSVEARETYRKLARMHSALETRHTSIATVGSLRLIPIDRILDRQRKRIIRISLSAAAALVLISTLILSLMRLPDAPIASFQTPPGAVFKLTHESEGNAPPEGNVLTKGSRLQLLSGALEANFQSGVRAVIEAPSDLRVLEIDHVELMKGNAWFEVPPKAVGFKVETEKLSIVDLGTAFGVVAASFDRSEVHVTKGSVEVRIRQGGNDRKTLLAGHALGLDTSGHLIDIPSQSDKFTTELRETLSLFVANHSFEMKDLENGQNSTDFALGSRPPSWAGRLSYGDRNPGGPFFFNERIEPTPDPNDAEQWAWSNGGTSFQVLEATFVPGATYTLTVDVGSQSIQTVPPGTEINLGTGTQAGTNLLAAKIIANQMPTRGAWNTWTTTFTNGQGVPGEPLRIELTSGGKQPLFDNVRLEVTQRVTR